MKNAKSQKMNDHLIEMAIDLIAWNCILKVSCHKQTLLLCEWIDVVLCNSFFAVELNYVIQLFEKLINWQVFTIKHEFYKPPQSTPKFLFIDLIN